MTNQDFNPLQAKLTQARAALKAAQDTAAESAEQQKQYKAAQDRFARQFDRDNPSAVAEKARLETLSKQAADSFQTAQASVQHARAEAQRVLADFAAFSDPRQNVGGLSDQSPFLLLPVRIETRFAKVSVDPTHYQLLVRIYPDDCSIDTFEPLLSASELINAQRYWRDIWRAGGIKADDRAAWRRLVSAHGSGRSLWIVDHYQPINLSQRPVKAAASDVILVIATQAELVAAEAKAAAAYWQAIWLSDNDSTKQQKAQAALKAAVGMRHADEIIANYRPYNLAENPLAPLKKSDVALSTAFVLFPADPPTKQTPWSRAPHVDHLADRFIVIGYQGNVRTLEAIGKVISLPLIVGPDPSADPEQAIHADCGGLFIPEELQWLVDFDRAVDAGMGLRIDLTDEQASQGFDRLLVLGLELSTGEADAKAALEQLLQHHHFGHNGLSLIRQGTPTNNATDRGSGYTRVDDPDSSFDDRTRAMSLTPNTSPLNKQDGQWLAELLGIDLAVLTSVHNGNGTDQILARAMHRALWPATLGYWMDKLMTPIFDDDIVEYTRWFFTSFVSGPGFVPAIRIGTQPYGILPTTAFSRMHWTGTDTAPTGTQGTFLQQLYGLWRKFDKDWTEMSKNASYVGKSGDPDQILLDIIGLHPASVEFSSRYSEGLTALGNMTGMWDEILSKLTLGSQIRGMDLLRKLGYTKDSIPDILNHVFLRQHGQLGNVIDDRPLSEVNPIRAYTDDGRNYIEWLISAARSSLDELYRESGFTGNKTPDTLLYMYLRHALMLGYFDAGYNLHRKAGFLSKAELLAMKPEPAFIHVLDRKGSESRFASLYKIDPLVTSDPTLSVADFITRKIDKILETRSLYEQVNALEILAKASTASLERAFAAHIDCCSYRFDAWLLGLVNFQLQKMRYGGGDGPPGTRTGVYLGAYAWVEDLRPSKVQPKEMPLPSDLVAPFEDTSPLVSDPSNGGYIHAPSLSHARTAAVLRSGYLANATHDIPEVMNVNLSSDRIRLALSILEGIRNGQSLGALLGYRFERGLHDAHRLREVDKFILPLRRVFPLVADRIETTKTDPALPTSIDAIEACNVLDGLKLLTHIRTGKPSTYPFGFPLGWVLPRASDTEQDAINAEVNRLIDAYDAIADLALAEGVHQAMQGNFERIAATFNAYTSGNFPPDPEVVQTPVSGIALTHRVAVHLRTGITPPANATPRSIAEPALNAWLAAILPPLDRVGCKVVWKNPVDEKLPERPVTVSLADLALQPLDLLNLIKPDDMQSMSELDDRILRFVIAATSPRPDAELHIQYMESAAGKLSIFQVAALVRSLKHLIDHARPLRATDAMPHGEATAEQDVPVFVDPARIAGPKASLDALSDDIRTFLATLEPLVNDAATNRAAIVSGIDRFLDKAVAFLSRAASFGLPSGWGFAFAWRHEAFVACLEKVEDLIVRWYKKRADFDKAISEYDALPASTKVEDRFRKLQAAEILVSTTLDASPATPAALRAALNRKRAAFAARLSQFQAVQERSVASFSALLSSVEALLPIADFDSQPFDVASLEDRAIAFATDLASNLAGHLAEIDKRRVAVQTQLAAYDTAGSATARVQALDAAAKALLGTDFRVIPEFELSASQGDEWANALGASANGSLLKYLTATAKIDFPVDEWLYGVARVRPMMRVWETVVALAGAFGRPEPALVPIQLPYEPDAPWMALQYDPKKYKLNGDRLLYTAQYASPFKKANRQCGLLLDEWTEVIPGVDRTTGITFNFDRPGNEPPQTMLLVTPATGTGAWIWEDLVGALNETLDLAKKRAVEPVHVDSTTYAEFLPATVMASTLYEISISTILAASSGVYGYLKEKP